MRFLPLWVVCWVTLLPAQGRSKPEFVELFCDEYQKNLTDPDAPQGVRVHWQTKNADHVIISGISGQKPGTGIIEGPGAWDFVAVGAGGATYQPLVCQLKPNSSTRPATPYHISHELMFLPNPSLKETVTTKHTLKEIRDAIIHVLQSMNFAVTEDPSIAVKNNLYIYTPEFVQIDSLADKKVERQIAFQVLVRPDAAGAQDAYEIQILAAVLRRYKMEGGDFQADPDGLKMGMPMAQSLFKSLQAVL